MNTQTLYETARYVGNKVRAVEKRDRAALEADGFDFNIHLIVGGQIAGLAPEIHLIYPQGNSIHATRDCPFLQIGETKYGKPILDRGFNYETSLSDAVKFGIGARQQPPRTMARRLFLLPARRVVPLLARLKGGVRPVPLVEDMAVPPEALHEFLVRAQRVLQRHQLTSSLYAHAASGQVHLRPFLPVPTEADADRIEEPRLGRADYPLDGQP